MKGTFASRPIRTCPPEERMCLIFFLNAEKRELVYGAMFSLWLGIYVLIIVSDSRVPSGREAVQNVRPVWGKATRG